MVTFYTGPTVRARGDIDESQSNKFHFSAAFQIITELSKYRSRYITTAVATIHLNDNARTVLSQISLKSEESFLTHKSKDADTDGHHGAALATVNARPLPRTDETSIIKESATGVGGGAVFREYNISVRLARKK